MTTSRDVLASSARHRAVGVHRRLGRARALAR